MDTTVILFIQSSKQGFIELLNRHFPKKLCLDLKALKTNKKKTLIASSAWKKVKSVYCSIMPNFWLRWH